MSLKNLFIIESPGKVKKISHILGDKYIVLPTVGHITHIPTKPFSINLDTFEASYLLNDTDVSVKNNKSKILKELKKTSKNVNEIYFATDPDRAGERIAYDVSNFLKIKNPKRLLFNEITKTAILKAIDNPDKLNENIINSQKTQESLDYLIGLKVSPVMSNFLHTLGLGAGRCMSVYTRLIYDNYKEIQSYKDNDMHIYNIECNFIKDDIEFIGKLNENLNKEDLLKFIENTKNTEFKIDNLKIKEQLNYPHPPLSTLELQKLSSSNLGFNPMDTMKYAQNLYEKGKISYIRTDTVLLPDEILKSTKEYIDLHYPGYSNQKQYDNKMKTAQEGHSAIYPIDINYDMNYDTGEGKLYNLIKKYTLASQMKPEIKQVYSFNILIKNIDDLFYNTSLKIQTFNGFKILFKQKSEKYTIEQLNTLKNNDLVKSINLLSTEIINKPPLHYDYNSLIGKLEKLEIGRPSTMASTINKIQDKRKPYIKIDDIKGTIKTINSINYNYITNEQTENNTETEIGAEKKKILITPLGIKTTEYLLEHFKDIMEYSFTAEMENKLSLIAEGKETYYNVMKYFYDILYQNLLEAQKIKSVILNILVGKYEDNDVFLKEGRYGLYLVCNKTKCTLTDFDKDEILNGGCLNDELIKKLFNEKLKPELNKLFDYLDKPVILKNGRFGEYIQWNNKNYSLKNIDKSNKDEIINLIKSKEVIKEFKCGKIFNGPYGLYIKDTTNPKRMINIPNDLNINDIDENKAEELIKSWKPKRKYNKKK